MSRSGPRPIQKCTYVSPAVAALIEVASDRSMRRCGEWLRVAALDQLRKELGSELVDQALLEEKECSNGKDSS